jgi:hypothetical protein
MVLHRAVIANQMVGCLRNIRLKISFRLLLAPLRSNLWQGNNYFRQQCLCPLDIEAQVVAKVQNPTCHEFLDNVAAPMIFVAP